jgi:hypothetical protein
MQLPSSRTAEFRAEMSALWTGIRTDSVRSALPAFFPEAAYARLKAFGDPKADFHIRLLLDYRLDIHAAHALLGGQSTAARLIAVRVPSAYAHWVGPGACYNRIGYYEVPNSRLVYSVNGTTRSLGIASMISWRGVWYVIHLGAVFRVGNIGIVHEPSLGPGSSVPSSTC